MAERKTWRDRWIHFMHRRHARSVARAALTTRFLSAPDPRTIGLPERGKQLVEGKFLFSGLLIEQIGLSIWDVADQYNDVGDEIHSFAWLDDLAALGTEKARSQAQDWVFEWIKRYGNARGYVWTPGVVGRRLNRWINHGAFVLKGRDDAERAQFFRSLAQQTTFLARRWRLTRPGLSRFEALGGVIFAGAQLEGLQDHVAPAVEAMARDCTALVDQGGALASRNPEDLLALLSILNWTMQALSEAGHRVPSDIVGAVDRIVPTLRALRHADGGLARFHGGGRGVDGRLDEALATSGVKTLPDPGFHMGFARMTGGRSTVIVDAGPPPEGPGSERAHASTLAFELTSGRRPIIVNCGAGTRFAKEWQRASRATPSHSTLGIDGVSSSRMGTLKGDWLSDVPSVVLGNADRTEEGRKLELSHDGYRASHGLTHARVLRMSVDGRHLECEDLLACLDDADERLYDKVQDGEGTSFGIRFHLHPDVGFNRNPSNDSITLRLLSGESWVFSHDGTAELEILPSVYLQNGQLTPIATHQVVLSSRTMPYATRVRWSLAKAQDTPQALRDLVQADPADLID